MLYIKISFYLVADFSNMSSTRCKDYRLPPFYTEVLDYLDSSSIFISLSECLYGVFTEEKFIENI